MLTFNKSEYKQLAEQVGIEKMQAIEQASGVSTGLLGLPKPQPKSQKKKADEKPEVFITCTKEEFLRAMEEREHTIADYKCIKFGEPDYVLCDHQHVKTQMEQIIALHHELIGYLKVSLELATKIGGMLLELKEHNIQAGNFGKWLDQVMPFCRRTGQRYMQLFIFREELAKKGITTISDAYKEINGECQENETIEADEGTKTSDKWEIVSTTVDVESLKLPRKKLKGIRESIHINAEIVERMEKGEFPFEGKHTHVKFVATIPSNPDHKSLLSRFIVAANNLLMPGGKLIFVKK